MAPSHKQWIIPFAVQLIPAGLLFIGALWIRESPRWLLSKNRREQAIKNLCWIRNLPADDIYIVEEIAFLDHALEEQAGTIGGLGFWQPFKAVGSNKQIQWRFFLGAMLFLWQNGSGINAINYYSPTVFASLGIRGTNTSFLTTGLFGVVKTSLTFVWLFVLIDRLGRRNLLLIGSTGGSICMWIIGGYLASIKVESTDSDESVPLSSGGYAAVFFFYLWTAFYTPSWNGTPWVLNSEMFDQSVRSLGQASAAMNNWFWNFIISRFTPQMFLNMGNSGCGVYFFFASMMLLSIPFVFFLIPETKGKSPAIAFVIHMLTLDFRHSAREYGPPLRIKTCLEGTQENPRRRCGKGTGVPARCGWCWLECAEREDATCRDSERVIVSKDNGMIAFVGNCDWACWIRTDRSFVCQYTARSYCAIQSAIQAVKVSVVRIVFRPSSCQHR